MFKISITWYLKLLQLSNLVLQHVGSLETDCFLFDQAEHGGGVDLLEADFHIFQWLVVENCPCLLQIQQVWLQTLAGLLRDLDFFLKLLVTLLELGVVKHLFYLSLDFALGCEGRRLNLKFRKLELVPLNLLDQSLCFLFALRGWLLNLLYARRIIRFQLGVTFFQLFQFYDEIGNLAVLDVTLCH